MNKSTLDVNIEMVSEMAINTVYVRNAVCCITEVSPRKHYKTQFVL